MHVGPWGAWCRPTMRCPRMAPASARVTSVHGFRGATPVPRCSFLARWRALATRFLELTGSGAVATVGPLWEAPAEALVVRVAVGAAAPVGSPLSPSEVA